MRGTSTVRLDGGTPYSRGEEEGFYNGDKFAIRVNSTGRAHLGDDDAYDIAPEKRTIDLQIISQETGQPINLVDTDGRTLEVESTKLKHSRGNSYLYWFSGQIDPKNTEVMGYCWLRDSCFIDDLAHTQPLAAQVLHNLLASLIGHGLSKSN